MGVLREDKTEVIFENKEDGKVNSRSYLAKLHYFEIHLAQGEHMAIQLESESSNFIYHNGTSSLLNVNEHTAMSIKSLKEGDVLAFSCSFWNNEAFEESEGKAHYYSWCQFLINGEAIGKAFRMVGKTVKPTIFYDKINTSICPSLIFGQSKEKKGIL